MNIRAAWKLLWSPKVLAPQALDTVEEPTFETVARKRMQTIMLAAQERRGARRA